MNAYQALVDAWHADLPRVACAHSFERLASGRITRREYAAILRQVFHHTRENPQLQALVTARFRGEERDLVKAFLRHALSEVGHDELALRDLQTLGEDVVRLRSERPLPSTFALIASAFHVVEHHDPAAYVGYLFHLEYTPVQIGPRTMEALERSGIPRSAMRFLAEHATVDVAHCRLVERYCETLLRTPQRLEAALAMRSVTATLYASMIDAAIESAASGEDVATAPTLDASAA